MDPKEPVIPDPDAPQQNPTGPVSDPADPDMPAEYDAGTGKDDDLEGYDEAEAESFPASDPPAASEPGV